MATRTDLLHTEQALRSDITRVEHKFDDSMKELRVEMRDMELRLIRWMVGSVIAGIGLAFTVFKLMS